MLQTSRAFAAADDTVVLHLSHIDQRALTLVPGQQLHCKQGMFRHDDIIGAAFGTRVDGKPQLKGEPVPQLIVLRLTPELWTQCLKHRTQIIYMTDIAVITTLLRLRPGSVVAEAGTGSGSLTHALARAVAPHGKVFTFDFHKARADEAKLEFASHGLGDVVVSGWCDVCRNGPGVKAIVKPGAVAAPPQEPELAREGEPAAGFGLPEASVDAVFLDVPGPWLGVANVLHVLRPGGILCTFSPCIEQTQKLCAALRESDEFLDLHTVEALTREYQPVFPSATPAGKPGKRERRPLEATSGEGEAVPVPQQHRCEGVQFKPRAPGKGHSAFLTFARRRIRL